LWKSLVAKSDVYSVFHQFQTLVEHQFSLKIKSVQTDWGGEYRKLSTFFQTIGIHHRLICPHTHEQNGTVERHHRHIVETGLTLLGQCKAPFRFWNYAFDTSVYLINRMPTLVLANQSPFDCLFQRPPAYHFLRTFGCLCFPFLRPYNNHKLDFRSFHVCFLATVPLILVIDVLTLNLIACISPVMFVFMNMFSRLIILNRLHRSQLKTTHHPLLPSSQI
jgi:histone deacetylase 1/2